VHNCFYRMVLYVDLVRFQWIMVLIAIVNKVNVVNKVND
jgi:hypothetical protein